MAGGQRIKRRQLHVLPFHPGKASGMLRLRWTLRAVNKIKLLRAKNAYTWGQNKQLRAEIRVLKKNLDAQTKVSKVVAANLYRSVEQTAQYMNRLVREKQAREEEMAMSSDVKDTLMSTFTTLEEGFLSQTEKLRGFMDREAKLKSQLRDAEEKHKEELLDLHGLIRRKERENARQLSQLQQRKDEWKRKCLALEGGVQTTGTEDRKRKRPGEARSAGLDARASGVREAGNDRPRKRTRKTDRKGSDEEEAGPGRAALPDCPWYSTPPLTSEIFSSPWPSAFPSSLDPPQHPATQAPKD
ncbi:uncharacterized protein LOC119617154 [Kryptolebias marmoratus]|uniref:uncharacterized protein LOC119617154 n=1 Tax=Kryptolebias marmoratus TaxID=37003 RepID=UPI0018ACE2FD|nr:uncharacterized protein LOC119617154 [Kryptolebias marmoratus]